MNKRNGLNDSDKVFVTVALWVSALALFATALSLPMLPDLVSIFYLPKEGAAGDTFSKYNNLLLILASVIPALIIIISSTLKQRNKLQNNFLSIMLFSIMLSLCMGSVMIYGILMQFDASSAIREMNIHALITLVASFFLSMMYAFMPMILHAPQYSQKLIYSNKAYWHGLRATEKYWQVGAYGFLVCAIICVFMPDFYCYIPLAICAAAFIVFIAVCGRHLNKSREKADDGGLNER